MQINKLKMPAAKAKGDARVKQPGVGMSTEEGKVGNHTEFSDAAESSKENSDFSHAASHSMLEELKERGHISPEHYEQISKSISNEDDKSE